MDPKFMSAVRKDHKILHSSLPLDIFVKSFEDRMVRNGLSKLIIRPHEWLHLTWLNITLLSKVGQLVII